MKYISLILSFVVLSSCNTKAQKAISSNANHTECVSAYDTLTKQQTYIKVEQMPEYPGGNTAFIKYFSSNFKQSSNPDDFQSSFNVEFIIDAEGNLIGERIKNKSISNITQAEKEALRVLKNTPKWTSGKCESKNVPVKMVIPIKF